MRQNRPLSKHLLCVLIAFGIAAWWMTVNQNAIASDEPAPDEPTSDELTSEQSRTAFIADVCRRIEMAARMWSLPPDFFARVIWKESRFDSNAVSPVGAQGIAQFMPGTARYRQLDDPFDLKTALPASAHYLFDLRNQFGNLGLAAAAYNAGPGRVQRWRRGGSFLPRETWNYVTSITGFTPDAWDVRRTGNNAEDSDAAEVDRRPKPDFRLHKDKSFQQACRSLPIRNLAPQPEFRKGPWQRWGGHLAADWSRAKAMAQYARLQRRFPSILGEEDPMVLRVRNPRFGRAPRYEVRIGAPDRKSASSFCKRLKRAGGLCIVLRTER